jgi:molybdopterin-guanine dinucleotide biosynthesis protein A
MNDVTLAILAGGAGARMGMPKGELRVGEKPILEYLLERFAWTGPTLLVTAPGREHPPGWERFNAEAVDSVADQGPLRGVLTALEHSPTEQVIVATVDMPEIGATQFRWLIERLAERPDAFGLMMRRGEQIEPFPSIFRGSAATMIRQDLAAQKLSVQALSRQAAMQVLPAPSEWNESVWTNLNRAEDLDAFVRRQSSCADR